MESKVQSKTRKGSLMVKLLLTVVPLMVIAVLTVMWISISSMKVEMQDAARRSLQDEAAVSVKTIETWSGKILSEYQMIKGAMETVSFESDEEEFAFMVDTMEKWGTICENGIYVGDASGRYLDASGWTPGDDFVVTERGWYKEGLEHDTMQFGEPYVDAETGEMVVSATALLKRSDRKNMVMSVDVYLNTVTDIVGEIKVMDTQSGYGFLVDRPSSTIIAHKDISYNGQVISADSENGFMAQIAGMLDTADGSVHTITDRDGECLVTLTPVDGTDWILVTSVSQSEALQKVYDLIKEYMVIGIVSILVVSLIMIPVIISVTKPVKKLTDTLVQIADGDFTVDIEAKGNDEIARMSDALQRYLQIMKNVIQNMHKISEDLDVNSNDGKNTASILSNTALEQQESMQNMQAAVDELARSVSELADDATTLAQIVDVTNSEGESASKQMDHVVDITEEGHKDIQEVQKVMKEMVVSMEELASVVEEVGKSTVEINEIIQLIEDISSQTNLLSLNASIEAARAGEAGRGFAVVASEIGHLADVSAQSTHKVGEIVNTISRHVEGMVEKTRRSMTAMAENAGSIDKACITFDVIVEDINKTSYGLKEIMEKIQNVDSIATNMAAISEEQSASAQEILATIEMLTTNSTKITEESKGVEESADVVADSANTLVENMRFFKV